MKTEYDLSKDEVTEKSHTHPSSKEAGDDAPFEDVVAYLKAWQMPGSVQSRSIDVPS